MCPRRRICPTHDHTSPDHSHPCPRRDLSHPATPRADHSHACVPGGSVPPTTTPRTRPQPPAYLSPAESVPPATTSHPTTPIHVFLARSVPPRPHLAPDHSHTCPRRNLSTRPHLTPGHSHTCVPGRDLSLGYAGAHGHEPHGPRARADPLLAEDGHHGFGSHGVGPNPSGDAIVTSPKPILALLLLPERSRSLLRRGPPRAPCTSASVELTDDAVPVEVDVTDQACGVLVRRLEFRRAGWPGTSVPARLSPADIEPGSAEFADQSPHTAGNTRGQRGERIRQVLARAHVMPQGVISGSQTRPRSPVFASATTVS